MPAAYEAQQLLNTCTELANGLGEQPPPPALTTRRCVVLERVNPRGLMVSLLCFYLFQLWCAGLVNPVVNCVGIQGSREALTLAQAV